MINPTIFQIVSHILVGIGVSAGLLALLIHAGLSGQAAEVFPRLYAIVTSISLGFIGLYIVASLLRTVLQTLRYRLILRSSTSALPGFFHIFLVTTSRNMFIDMLPSRLGELSYVAMLRRGYQVPVATGLSSLALAFLFDLAALGVLIAAIILYQLVTVEVQWWLLGTALLVLFAFLVGTGMLFPGLSEFIRLSRRATAQWRWRSGKKLAEKGLNFLEELSQALRHAREAGIAGRVMFYSIGVRITKYLGLYCLFYGIVGTNFPEVQTNFAATLMALLSAEAGASLPLPTFMGFGSYETGGMLTMIALGATREASLLIMLSLHLLTQMVDYLMGGLALLAFMVLTFKGKEKAASGKAAAIPWLRLAGALLFCAAVAYFLLQEYRDLRTQRAMMPPTEFGQAVSAESGQAGQGPSLAAMLQGRKGFMVWSSNRSGNHDLWLQDLPDGTPRQLTTHPHAEYYPRVSPDGGKIVFSRANKVWASHRDFWSWDLVLLDLATGEERELAKDANVPTWSADGRKIYFQRDGRQVVELDLVGGRENVVLESGKNVQIPADTWLGLPNFSPRGDRVALTLSGALRTTAIIERNGRVHFTGNGCQLAWAPDGSYLIKVDHGGRQQNVLYRLDPEKREAVKWFDAPGEFSHEYFPRIVNTGDLLVYGASSGDHEHDKADYELFLWQIGQPPETAVRLTFHSGNDNWPDIYLYPAQH
ncbi:MAG: lysylphosphatidylglycerol synthase domain-containing protein [bacterium]|nr:lysylphosphatidylglycerol synthase domain-containing protein [bacterium]